MKNLIKISVLLLTLTLAINCTRNNNDDYESPYGDYSSFIDFTTGGDFDTSERYINFNDYVSFYDLSQNALSHTWTIPEATELLKNGFTKQDSIYAQFVIVGASKVTNEKLINVYFPNTGVQEIKLHNTFKDSVTGAIKEGDLWVLDKTYTVTVFPDVNPACKIYHNGDEVFSLTAANMPSLDDKASWPTVSIEAGEELVFEDLSTVGNPDTRKFYCEGGKPEISNNASATIKYNKLGEFTAWMESIRTKSDVTPGLKVSKLIPIIINVIPSTKPFEFGGGLKADANGLISFSVTGEIEGLLNQNDNFTVHVVNTDAGFDQNIAVQSAAINSTDATIIELTLAAPIFNTDDITVSFAGGNITSVDARVLKDFGPEVVGLALGNSVLVDSWASYENASSSGNTLRKADCDGYWVGASNNENKGYYRNTENAFSGAASMRYSTLDGITSDIRLQGGDFSKPSGVLAGKYRISYMVYLETGNTMSSFTTLVFGVTPDMNWDISSLPRDKWVEVSQIITVPDVPSGTRFDLWVYGADNPNAQSTAQTMYFDNLKWIPLNPRM